MATLHQAQSMISRVAAPIKIERFDNLSTWDIFQVPRLVEVKGSDHLAQMNVVLPVTCVGPLDPITVLVNISPNPDWLSKARKIRVNKIQVYLIVTWTNTLQISIEEILSFKASDIIQKKKRILRSEQDCHGVKLDVYPSKPRS